MAENQNNRTPEAGDETAASEQQLFEYLDLLSDSGVTHMFGAVPFLMRDCGLSRPAASKVLALWMRTFAERQAVRP